MSEAKKICACGHFDQAETFIFGKGKCVICWEHWLFEKRRRPLTGEQIELVTQRLVALPVRDCCGG